MIKNKQQLKPSSKVLKSIPRFKNEDEEIEFWDNHDLTDYLHVFKPVKLDFSKLKPSTTKVTLRLPQMMLDDLRMLANEKDVPYQSLMKIFLSQSIKKEYSGRYSSKS